MTIVSGASGRTHDSTVTRARGAAGACSRRDFLILALSVLGATATGRGCSDSSAVDPGACQQPRQLPETVLDLRALLSKYFEHGELTDVRAIGRAYIERFVPDECALIEDVSHTVRSIAGIDSIEVAVQTLEAAVVTDFDADRRTSLSGWQLASTEVRLCALVELLEA